MAYIGRKTADPETVHVVGKSVASLGDKHIVEVPLKVLLAAARMFEQQDATTSKETR